MEGLGGTRYALTLVDRMISCQIQDNVQTNTNLSNASLPSSL